MDEEWIGWLEEQEAKAIAADPTLLDRERSRNWWQRNADKEEGR